VEVNALRETLGTRPTPRALAGALKGTLHCTGPLDHPVFSGMATTTTAPFAGVSPPGAASEAIAAMAAEGAVRPPPTPALVALLGSIRFLRWLAAPGPRSEKR
jgi:hypothetical protein